MSFGDNLRIARQAAGLTQKEAGTRLSLEQGTISNYENDIRSPDPKTTKRMADLYHVSTDTLYAGIDEDENELHEDPVYNTGQAPADDAAVIIMRLTSKEYEHIVDYRALSDNDQAIIFGLAKKYLRDRMQK